MPFWSASARLQPMIHFSRLGSRNRRAVRSGSCWIVPRGCRPRAAWPSSAREVPVLIAVTDQATALRREQLDRVGCEVVAFPGSGRVPIVPLLQELGRRGMTNVLVEGGGQTAGSFLDAGQVDAVDVFIAPSLEGGNHARTARSRFRPILDEPGEAD